MMTNNALKNFCYYMHTDIQITRFTTCTSFHIFHSLIRVARVKLVERLLQKCSRAAETTAAVAGRRWWWWGSESSTQRDGLAVHFLPQLQFLARRALASRTELRGVPETLRLVISKCKMAHIKIMLYMCK